MILPQIQNVIQHDTYELEISFTDGKVTLVDFEPFLSQSQHPAIRKYLESSLFAEFKVEDGDLMWGDFDLIFPLNQLYTGEFASQHSWSQFA